MALETRNFNLTGFYVQEVSEYQFYLSKDNRIVIGEGGARSTIKLQREGREDFHLGSDELICLNSLMPHLAVAIDSTDVKLLLMEGLEAVESKNNDISGLNWLPSVSTVETSASVEQHVPEQQQSHQTKRKLSAPQDKQLVKKQKLKNKNQVRNGTSLVEELIKLKQAEQLRKVEDMLINELYAGAVTLRVNNLVAEKSGCRKCKTGNAGLSVK